MALINVSRRTLLALMLLTSTIHAFGIVPASKSTITSSTHNRAAAAPTTQRSTTLYMASSGFLLSDSTRATLVKSINKYVDIPLLSESMEGELISTAIDAMLSYVETILLKEGENGDVERSSEETETKLVNLINENINVPGLDEAQEETLIRGVVAQLFELYPEATRQVPM